MRHTWYIHRFSEDPPHRQATFIGRVLSFRDLIRADICKLAFDSLTQIQMCCSMWLPIHHFTSRKVCWLSIRFPSAVFPLIYRDKAIQLLFMWGPNTFNYFPKISNVFWIGVYSKRVPVIRQDGSRWSTIHKDNPLRYSHWIWIETTRLNLGKKPIYRYPCISLYA